MFVLFETEMVILIGDIEAERSLGDGDVNVVFRWCELPAGTVIFGALTSAHRNANLIRRLVRQQQAGKRILVLEFGRTTFLFHFFSLHLIPYLKWSLNLLIFGAYHILKCTVCLRCSDNCALCIGTFY